MRYTLLLGVVVFLSGKAEAAPKGPGGQVRLGSGFALSIFSYRLTNVDGQQAVARIVQEQQLRPMPPSGDWTGSPRPTSSQGRSGTRHNGTNTTTTAGTITNTFSLPLNRSTSPSDSRCPLRVVTSTLTVDVTFYITATTSYGHNTTSVGVTGTVHRPSLSSSESNLNSTKYHTTWNTTCTSMQLSTRFTQPAHSSQTSTVPPIPTDSEPADGSTIIPTLMHNTTSTTPIHTTKPCNDDSTYISRPNSTATTSSTPLRSIEIRTTRSSTSGTQRTTFSGHKTSTGTGLLPTSSRSLPANETSNCISATSTISRDYSTASFILTSETRNETLLPTLSSSSPVPTTSPSRSSSSSTTPRVIETPSQHAPTSSAFIITSTSISTLAGTSAMAEPCEDESSVAMSITSLESTMTTAHGISISRSDPVASSMRPSSSLRAADTVSTRSDKSEPWATETSTGTANTTSVVQTLATPATHVPTESCVIDTSMVPIISSSLSSVPTSTLTPTKTVCQYDAPTGKPMPGNHHCGVHGLPVGKYFLARFVDNAAGVPVTLEGCYQFCASIMNVTDGCKSYRFYPESGLNVPRCDLYGSNVAYALDSINNNHPDIWFDLSCASPADEKWAHLPGMTRLRELGLFQ